nr:MAG TPA: hypothetical protein [Caudoviricetes sp.]
MILSCFPLLNQLYISIFLQLFYFKLYSTKLIYFLLKKINTKKFI